MTPRITSALLRQLRWSHRALATFLAGALLFTSGWPLTALAAPRAQDPVTGAFQGRITDAVTNAPVPNASIQFTNVLTGVPVAKRADGQGNFYQGLLQPGTYRIRVTAQGYQIKIVENRLFATKGNDVNPLPIRLDPAPLAQTPPPTQPTATQPTATQPTTAPVAPVTTPTAAISSVAPIEINRTDASRSGAFTEEEVTSLPLGSTTYTRTFDSLALLLPGVALPPQTQGRVAGPGVGPGVGSAGQFAVNGLRSRANNFLVDGSDNNDEDIGVRRQGFFTLVPQPPESIREYQIITGLAPAQFGRNIGAQVNAISKSGGYETHGSFYGFLNASDLNARNFFDTVNAGTATPLTARTFNGQTRNVFLTDFNFANGTSGNRRQLSVSNPANAKDSQTFGQGGFVLGGPLLPRPQTDANGVTTGSNKSAFYFMSFEGQLLNANQETNFIVPTVEQRGFLDFGATGFLDAFGDPSFPASAQGNAVFSLYPFANNPNGVYGRNTYTQLLPASAQGYVGSFKMDHSFKFKGRDQSVTGRYNRTHDWRNIPATGGALFATLRPVVGTQNFSFFWNGELSAEGAMTPVFNQFRASYGRTRLNFEEERDRSHLLDSSILSNTDFLLNAPLLLNVTDPSRSTGAVEFGRALGLNTELGFPIRQTNGVDVLGTQSGGALGPIGQVIIPGFSPLGVDVNFFPQNRVNNTFQLADILSFRKAGHSAALGVDVRRVQLNSNLPRNARTQLVFGGAPLLLFGLNDNNQLTNFRLGDFAPASSLAALGAASSVFTTLQNTTTPNIGLRYTQYNAFGQDEWRVLPNLSLSYGLRYEYNSPPSEVDGLIEKSFSNPALNLAGVAGLKKFIAGRDKIFEADRNNFGPRVGLAYSHDFGLNRTLVVRAGYGLYYDQILGAVVSQSRNVFPNFLTINTGGGLRGGAVNGQSLFFFNIFNAGQSLGNRGSSNGIRLGDGSFQPYVQAGTLNQYNTNLPLEVLVNVLNRETGSGFGLTLPNNEMPTPMAQQYTFSLEQQLGANLVAGVSYFGTRGSNLLRQTTPNLGPNLTALAATFADDDGTLLPLVVTDTSGSVGLPALLGSILGPGQRLNPNLSLSGGRPTANAGTVYIFQSNGESQYNSLQLQLRGRFRTALQWQASYTLSKATDDVSDVFDLAGAPALPQNSLQPEGEYARANFDARHRFSYSLTWALPTLSRANRVAQLAFGGFEVTSTGQFQTGQPFTVNSIFDVNLDGNLTDRLATANGINRLDSRRQPLQLVADPSSLRAIVGRDGTLPRNYFTGSNYLLLDLALAKHFNFTEHQRLTFRVEAFNFLNRANFALPVRFLEAPAFGSSVDTVTPGRRIQFALKYSF